MLVCLALLLSACATPQPIIKKEYQVIRPPELLISPCHKPNMTGSTWGDLAIYSVELKHELNKCSQKIDGIRAFIDKELNGSI